MKSLKTMFARAALPAVMLLGLSHEARAQTPDQTQTVRAPGPSEEAMRLRQQRLREITKLQADLPPPLTIHTLRASGEALHLRDRLREMARSQTGLPVTQENFTRAREDIGRASKEYTDSIRLKAADTLATIPVYGCMDITSGGNYILQNDIVANKNQCINIYGTTDQVVIDGQGHTMSTSGNSGGILLYASGANEPFITNTTFSSPDSSSPGYVVVSNTTEPIVTYSTFNNAILVAVSSPYALSYFNGLTGPNSEVALASSDNAVVASNGVIGSAAQSFISQNSNNGLYYSNSADANNAGDDGFVFWADPGHVVSGNQVQGNVVDGFYDCGIEIVGHHTNMTLEGNSVSNTRTLFGGWYGASLDHSNVTNNTGTYNVGSLFTFGYFGGDYARGYPDPSTGPGIALFNNNTFSGNRGGGAGSALNPGSTINYATTGLAGFYQSPPYGGVPIPSAPGDIANNRFLNNSFNEIVRLTPAQGNPAAPYAPYIDAGNNTCVRGNGTFPYAPPVLRCSGPF